LKNQIDFFAEQRLLNTLYFQPIFLDSPEVKEEIFSSQATRNVYRALVYLRQNNITNSRDALMQEYGKIDLDASSAVIDIITEKQLQEIDDIKDIIFQLLDAKKRRKTISELKAAIKKIEDVTHLNEENLIDIKDHIGNAELELILDKSSTKRVMNFEEWTDEYNKELNLRRKGKQYYFYNFMFDELVPDGPRPGEIGIIASASGSGKSTICLALINSLIDVKVPCMYFSLEMSSIATMDRLLSKRLEIKYHELVSPKDAGQFEDICAMIEHEKQNLLENKLFRFSEDASMNLLELRKHIQKFQAEINQRYCIVALDLLSMITDFTKFTDGLNFAQGIEVAMNKLSAIAKELGIHIIGVLQFNRAAETEGKLITDAEDLNKFRPNRAQIKNANAFLERSRYVLSSFRPKMYAELYMDPIIVDGMIDKIEISVVKINNARIGKTVSGLFNGEYFDISPLPDVTTI
jgi:replicative DNA helicase